jgi:TetR/AcrR family transcriptional regulator
LATATKTKHAAVKPKEVAARSSGAKPPKRVRRPEQVKARILQEALEAFATSGFDGASARQIAKEAGVSLSLLLYHFTTKEELWKAVFEDIFKKGSTAAIIQEEHVGQAPAAEQLKVVIEHIVQIFAMHPALHRLMTLEGHKLTDRLVWMFDTYLKKDFRDICNLVEAAQKEGKVHMVDPERLRFAIIALAAVPFSVSAEYEYVTKRNPFSPSEIRNSVEFINRLVFK